MKQDNLLLRIDKRDSVAVALADLPCSASLEAGGIAVTLKEDIPFGHKVALYPVKKGENVIKYGAAIGHATEDIEKGSWVHTHNLATNLSEHLEYGYDPVHYEAPEKSEMTFEGYLRHDGRAATRNEIWIIPTVGCVNRTAENIAKLAQERFAGMTDGIFAFTHNMGCSQMGEDMERTERILAGLADNPNAAGVLILSLGCENCNLDSFMPFVKDRGSRRIKTLVCQEVEDETEEALKLIGELVKYASGFKRQTLPLSGITLGFKCGGSDAFSGITANALCGKLNDVLCASGASTMLTEVPEMFGAETFLMERAASEEVFNDIVGLINGFKAYYTGHGQTVYENPSPGNKKGGITTLEEKSLGCIQKGGHAEVNGVLEMGSSIKSKGLHLLTGPGNDQVSCTNLTASGANLIIFTTGRGNPYGAPVPTVKLASNSRLAEKKHGWIDFSAGGLIENSTFEELTEEFLRYICDVASGRVMAKNEINGYREISVFRDGVIL